MKDLRSIVVKIVIGSFSLAALMGITALLVGGDMDGTPGKVLLTTLLVGAESVAVLCYLSTAGTRWAALGAAGGLVSLVPFGVSLWLIWVEPNTYGDGVWKSSGVGLAIGLSIAQACLLLAVAERPQPRVRLMLRATLATIVLVAVMIIVPILIEDGIDDWYWRIFGIIAILDVLGTVAVAALAKFGAKESGPAPTPALLSPALEARMVDAAARRGVTPTELITQALDDVR